MSNDFEKDILEFKNSLKETTNQNNRHLNIQQRRCQSSSNTNNDEVDLEFRDKINDRVSNMRLSRPYQSSANHYFDTSIISDNPQYINQNLDHDNMYRKDNRDGMNSRLDSLMFQNFQENPKSNQYSQPRFQENNNMQVQEPIPSEQNFLSELPNPFNNTFHQTSRVSNRDLHNERIQQLTSLPRTLNQPTSQISHINDRSPSSPYRVSYESQYYQNGRGEGTYLGNVGRSTGGYLPGTFQNSRDNYKDQHNERLQNLEPLARTCATPLSTTDYTKSVIMNQNQFVNTRDQQSSRQQQIQPSSRQWNQNVNAQMPLSVDTHRPVDTRQSF